MAKKGKSGTKRAAGKKGKPARGGKPATNGAGGKRKRQPRERVSSPRSAALPGMEHVRDVKLDRICESIGDERDAMNKARTEEKGLIQSALQQMQRRNTTVYRHAGVELSRVPGAEKLRVRMTKEEGDADERDLEVDPDLQAAADEAHAEDAAAGEEAIQ